MIRHIALLSLLCAASACSLGELSDATYAPADSGAADTGGDTGGVGPEDTSDTDDGDDEPDADGDADTPDSDAGRDTGDAGDVPDTPQPGCIDGDNDGYGEGEECSGPDCDDGDQEIGPPTRYFRDFDDDGWGNGLEPMDACTPPQGYVTQDGDCDDTDAEIAPGLPDICDGKNNDCDEDEEEDPDLEFYPDNDEDTYGDAMATPEVACEVDGWVLDNTDCNDGVVEINPGVAEDCSDEDLNCDGDPHAGAPNAPTWYRDFDNDTYGDPDTSQVSCVQPDGYVDNDRDCRDLIRDINPDADELCDATDHNCDGDPHRDAIDRPTWYMDFDGDGYGDDNDISVTCEPPPSYVAVGGDCDDMLGDVFPGSTHPDVPTDDIDHDCDGHNACLDLGCDGLPDLIYGEANGRPRVVRGTVTGLELADSIPLLADPYVAGHVDRGDFNGDGWMDIVLVHGPGGNFQGQISSHVLVGGDGVQQFVREWTFSTTAAEFALVADLNADGFDDLVIAEPQQTNDQVYAPPVVRFGAVGGFVNLQPVHTSGILWASAGYLDGDDLLDLVISPVLGNAHILLSTSNWNLENKIPLAATQSRFNLVDDFDNDGIDDVLIVNSSPEEAVHTIYYGPDFSQTSTFESPASDHAAAMDINGDGFLDLAFAARTDRVAIYATSASRTWRKHTGHSGATCRRVGWGWANGRPLLAAPGYNFQQDTNTISYLYRVTNANPDGTITVARSQFSGTGQGGSLLVSDLEPTGHHQVLWGNSLGPGQIVRPPNFRGGVQFGVIVTSLARLGGR